MPQCVCVPLCVWVWVVCECVLCVCPPVQLKLHSVDHLLRQFPVCNCSFINGSRISLPSRQRLWKKQREKGIEQKKERQRERGTACSPVICPAAAKADFFLSSCTTILLGNCCAPRVGLKNKRRYPNPTLLYPTSAYPALPYPTLHCTALNWIRQLAKFMESLKLCLRALGKFSL